jgi:hypothetical protein
MISDYFDGELPSPWKEKLESHISSCVECQKTYAAYAEISRVMAVPADAGMNAARERIWHNLTETYGFAGSSAAAGILGAEELENAAGAGNEGRFSGVSRGVPRRFAEPSLWRKSVRVPLPAAAAAAAILVFSALFPLLQQVSPTGSPAPVPNAMSVENIGNASSTVVADLEPLIFDPSDLDFVDFDVQTPGSISTLNDVLRYIESSDSSNVVIINLPEKRHYSRMGGPAILRAVDYAKSAYGGGNKN